VDEINIGNYLFNSACDYDAKEITSKKLKFLVHTLEHIQGESATATV
jgi:hypothetical protein